MKFDSTLGLISVLTLCSVSTMALAIGSQALDRQLDSVSRQVEQKTERAIERSMGRRLDAVEQRIESRVEQARGQLPRLPRSLPIHTQQGGKAFNDVMLDDGFRAVERQWLATGTAAEVAELDRPGITILERRELSGLGMILVRFRVAPALDSWTPCNRSYRGWQSSWTGTTFMRHKVTMPPKAAMRPCPSGKACAPHQCG